MYKVNVVIRKKVKLLQVFKEERSIKDKYCYFNSYYDRLISMYIFKIYFVYNIVYYGVTYTSSFCFYSQR